MKLSFTTTDEDQTRELGRQIGESLQPGTVIGLSGTLGAGKTRLAQGIGMGLGVPMDQIVSPTFTLLVPHEGRLTLIHLDAYRINHAIEIDELGLDELIEDGAVLVIEWPERFVRELPRLDLRIRIDHTSDQERIVNMELLTDRGQSMGRQLEFP